MLTTLVAAVATMLSRRHLTFFLLIIIIELGFTLNRGGDEHGLQSALETNWEDFIKVPQDPDSIYQERSDGLPTSVVPRGIYGSLYEEWLASNNTISNSEIFKLLEIVHEEGYNVSVPTDKSNLLRELQKVVEENGFTDSLLEAMAEYEKWLERSREGQASFGDDTAGQGDQGQYRTYRKYGYLPRQKKNNKHKANYLGVILKERVETLRRTPDQKLELVFLVDSSATVGRSNFANELKFVSKLLIDFAVDRFRTRVALVTFSSQDRVIRHIDHLKFSDNDHNKCSLLESELSDIHYTGGATDTLGALREAESILERARPGSHSVIFLITDGYSNYGDPRPLAATLREGGVEIFTIGIMQGNTAELYDMASLPKKAHAYFLDTFDEFEALARRALHKDLQPGDYFPQRLKMCNNLCQEKEECCDDHATCRCGTHTGKYECVCQPGFYGSGLKGQCFKCPAGSYKDTASPGDVTTCIKCPDENHVSQAGSATLSECVCKAGHRATGSHRCAAMMCPKLSAPKHGYFVQKCDNVFNAGCGIRCDHGYKLIGKSVRLCKEDGTWSGEETRCEVRKCRPIPAPNNGTMQCTNGNFTFGTTCRFRCNEGFQLVGSKERSCLSIEHWDGIKSKCREILCPPLPPLLDGTVLIPECTQKRMPVGTTCFLRCKSGYKMAGHNRKMCRPSGEWAPIEQAENRCIDVQPPMLICPDHMTVSTSPDESHATVTWQSPTAIDNSGYHPPLSFIPVMRLPAQLPIGTTTFTYVAVDKSGNKGKCSFNVSVRDRQPPRIDRCVSPRPFIAKGGGMHITWDEPHFSDNSNEPLKITRSHEPGRFPPGITDVIYTAVDMYGNNNTCIIHINVQDNACADPVPPKHGYSQCSQSRNGVECLLHCKPGYDFAIRPAERYFCDLNTGYWLPANRWPFPDCAVSHISNHVTQFSNVVLHAQTTCDDHLHLTKIEENYINTVTNRIDEYCGPHINCEVRSANTICTPHLVVDENEIQTNVIDELPSNSRVPPNDLHALPFGQGKTLRTAAKREDSLLEIKLELEGSMDMQSAAQRNKQEVQSELVQTMKDVIFRLTEEAQDGLYDIMESDQPVKYETTSMDSTQPKFTCPVGSVLREQLCVNCPIGTYYNVINQECESCGVGTYQPNEGQLTCLVCPTNTSTTANNSKSVNQCKGQCLPGSFSSDGLEQCETCPKGFFQQEYAQTSCVPCPEGNTTHKRGVRTRAECAAKCPPGYVSKSGLSTSEDPCLACPRGYFQPIEGRAGCLLCPNEVGTKEKASTKVSDCEGVSEEDAEDYLSIPIEKLVLNECFTEPCMNSATCQSLEVGYLCLCAPGWTGQNCESDIDECLSNPCHHNATCVDLSDAFECKCTLGYEGVQCERNIDDCYPNPCANNGTCQDGIGDFRCRCALGFDGTTCENNVDDCLSDPCQHGGVCLDHIGHYTCTCPPGYQGDRCDVNIDECLSTPCMNNATCFDEIDSFRCECVPGYAGNQCEEEIFECLSSPCMNGATCEDLVNEFKCHCLPSYTGMLCETKLNSSFDMTWARVSVDSYLRLDCCGVNMSEVTVTFWVNTTDKSNFGTPVSYATTTNDNELSITDYNGFTLYVHGLNKVTDVQAADGRWHHLAVTWSSPHGHWEIYKDGLLQDEGDGLAKGKFIEGGGVFIVGQDQDSKGKSFNSREAFIGSLTRLNVWGEVLTAEEIKESMNSCEEDRVGSLVAWADFLGGVHGDVEKTDSAFCRGCNPPPPISHGNVTFNGTSVETSFSSYTCDLGYDLIGQLNRKCRISSNWEGESPLCRKKKCPRPQHIPHGTVRGLWYVYGASIRYHCVSGYRLVGNSSQYCNASGVWEGQVPRCNEIICDIPSIESPLRLRENSRKPHKPGEKLRLQCIRGYRMVGRASILCGEDGQWTNGLPSCEQMFCGHAPDVENARPLKSQDRYAIDSDILYVCNDGYAMDGPNSIHCQTQGSWEAFRPACKLVTCIPPPDIPHGAVQNSSGTSFVSGSTVTYVCRKGFVIGGAGVLRCSSEGVWNSSAPTCEKIHCPPPEAPNNGSVEALSNRFRDIATYECDTGYSLRGSQKRICSSSGGWSPSLPVCEAVSCGEPTSISFGEFQGTSFKFGDSVRYVCEEGYVLEGLAESFCGADGNWINLVPSCSPVECPKPRELANGRILANLYTYLSSVTYNCMPGYRLVGNFTRVCKADGTWDGETPYCKEIVCMEPSTLLNGVVSATGHEFRPGRVVKYSCNLGYALSGKTTRTCRGDGTWTGPMPRCKSITCSKPNDILFGQVNFNDMRYGSMAKYECNDGYQLDGTAERMCSADKTWSGSEPSCEAISCPAPDSISKGRYEGDSFELGEEIMYKCEPGYILIGKAKRTCLENQRWSQGVPWCKAVECPKPSKRIPNGRMMNTNFTYGNTIRYVCDSGHEINGPSTRTCQSDGTWNSAIPACDRVPCPKPLSPPNGRVEGYEYKYKETVSYLCNTGYELEGQGERLCQADRTWSGVIPNCVRVQCSIPPELENGKVIVDSRFYLEKVDYECNTGYRIEGSRTLVCQSDKSWYGTTPMCHKIKCTSIPSIEHGIVLNDADRIYFGDIIDFRCDPGYVLSNSSLFTCSSGGNFRGTLPRCVRIKCRPPVEVNNAEIVGLGERYSRPRGYGDTIEYICRPGYELHGNKYQRCDHYGQWSGKPPECRPVICPPPENIPGGTYSSSGEYHFGERIVYTCEVGFQLEGETTRSCEANRRWSGSSPTCVRTQCSYPEINFGYVQFIEPPLQYDSKAPADETPYLYEDVPKYDYGSVISIECETGYELSGKGQITCIGKDEWKPGLPSCVRVKCDAPKVLNGIVSSSDPLPYLSSITVSCLEGFRLVGQRSLQCSSEGTWENLPECHLVTCNAPVFSNGRMLVVRSPHRGSGYPYGMTIKFDCDDGYLMTGENIISCQDSGHWSSRVPLCNEIRCEKPQISPESKIYIDAREETFTLGSNISLVCNDGYEINGNNILQCGLDGKIKGTMPTCTLATCPRPTFENGKVYSRDSLPVDVFPVGSVVAFRCIEGWRLEGRREIACQSDKTWSSEIPKCHRIRCQDLDIENGRVISAKGGSNHFLFEMKALFTCNDGYEIEGPEELTCQANGRWSGSTPSCTKIKCHITAIENAQLVPFSPSGQYEFEDRVSVQCDEGYHLSESSSELICRSDGSWSKKSPKCLISYCATPVITNGKVVTVHPDDRQTPGTNVFGQTIRFQCDQGYKLKGIDHAECQGNSTWSREPSKCEKILCPQIVIKHGRVANALRASLALGSSIRIQCLVGYAIHGDRRLECVGDGVWIGTIPKCVPKQCPTPVIAHGNVLASMKSQNSSKEHTFGDSIRIVCHDGYELVGQAEMVCQSDQSWSVTSPPHCEKIMCPPFPQVQNSDIMVMAEEGIFNDVNRYMKYGTSVQVACMPGYQLEEGDSRLTCGMNKEWMGTVPACNAITCPLVSVDNANVIGRASGPDGAFMSNDIVRVVCNEGYGILNGNVKITCLENGTWSTSFPTCGRRRCADLPLQNGRVIGDSFLFGDKVSIVCNEGYKLLGTPECQCRGNGEWDCMPLCYRISCLRPASIANGNYIATGNHFGDRLRYQCIEGFEIGGSAERICQADREWSGEVPSCHRSSCPEPEQLENGRVIGSSYIFGEKIEYMCEHGYQLLGNHYSECMADKSWGPKPTCKRISCGRPQSIVNGKALGDNYFSGATVRYTCNEGYSSRGNIDMLCLDNGAWRGRPPVCEPISCSTPMRTANGFFLGSKRQYKAVIEHHCNRGFRMKGENKQECQANGTWSGHPPRCSVIMCNSPAPIQNGHIEISSYFYGSVISYKCDYGFYLDGFPQRRCTENATWTDEDPQCRRITCPIPTRIANGYYMGTDTIMEAMVFYTCDHGYQLQGSSERVCQENRTWSNADPQCVPKSCAKPQKPANGTVSVDGYLAGSTATYLCNTGFTMNGKSSLTCINGERWSHEPPVCTRTSCGPPIEIEYGFYDEISYVFMDVVTYRCEAGYIVQGNPQITCQASGQWTLLEARCVIGDCGSAPFISHATISEPFTCDTGRCVSYICDEGYEQKGLYVIRCGPDGTWQRPLPECVPKACGLPPVIHHGSNVFYDLDSGGRVAEYTCNPGYILDGSPMIYCMANGSWVIDRKPECKPVDCGVPPEVHNSLVLSSAHTLGHYARYRCKTGFKQVGHAVIECMLDGSWNDTGPVCVGRTCPRPEQTEHGYINSSDIVLGASIEYICDRGYLPNGDTNRTCIDGRWTGSPPRCKIIKCPALVPPQNGHLSTQLRIYNTVVTVSCHPGYLLLGNQTLNCLETGDWNSPLPRCSYSAGSPCAVPLLPEHVNKPTGPFHVGDTLTFVCSEGYIASGSMDITCTDDKTWTPLSGKCKVAYCGSPRWPDPNLVVRLLGRSYAFGSQMVYSCRNGLTPATHPILTCTAQGVWDNTPRCIASCKFECQNGGTCIGANKCKCKSGYAGKFCEQAVCILQCLNGGRCTAPYHCECPFGYTGPRCQKAVCHRECANGGRCIRPNRCQCPLGFKPPFCDEESYIHSIDSLQRQTQG